MQAKWGGPVRLGWILVIVVTLLVAGCSENKAITTTAASAGTAGADTQTTQPDVAVGSEGDAAIDLGGNDIGTSDAALACPGGAGCACGQNAECESGFCLDTQAGKSCAQKCIDTCPTGLVCAQVPGAGGDLVSICVEKFGHLCDPCTASSQCLVAGQADPRCINYGKIGAFCGSACSSDADCGEAYACKKVPTIEGPTAQQCVRKAVVADELGICPCSKRAVSLALTTTCYVDHKGSDGKVFASCAGQRACLAVGIDGLAACQAAVPGAEMCDGKDNDCDGITDEVSCDDGNPCTADACSPGAAAAGSDGCTHIAQIGQTCDDNDPCTTGSVCDKGGVCGGGKSECECAKTSDCMAKEDGDACNGSLFCDLSALPYKCKVDPASVVTCDSDKDTACATNDCDKATGKCALLPKAASTVCDDGDACTLGDNCQSGNCTAGTTICQCQTTADCGAQEDGNVCNGTLYCDKTAFPFLCKVNPATLVVCPSTDGGSCAKNTCQPKTGQCAVIAVENGTACDADGNKCTIGDACQAGACVVGENLCDCKANGDCASKEDGDLCNGTLFCNKAKGKCEVNPQTVVNCPTASDTACTKSQCEKNSGACKLQPVPDNTACFDGSLCTTGDVCLAGSCVGSASTCACLSDADCAGKDDGDLCNGTLFCDKAKGSCQLNPATVVSCPNVNDTVCLANQCEKKTGKCQMTPTNNACEDGNPCTNGDACANGLCQPGANACPCTTTADCKVKEDSNLCNGTLVCNKALGACLVDAETIVTCPKDKDTVCQKSVCAAATGSCGLYAINQGVACSDGEVCTQGEFCQLGVCSSGVNICPCQADSDCAAKDDGDLCNGVLTCNKALLPGPGCQYDAASVVTCSKAGDSACLQNLCGKTTGLCKMTAVAGACSDGEPCTAGDYCSEGNCLSGKNTCPCLVAGDCDDKVACTVDSCDKAKGCSHGAIDGLCDDAQVCTADSCDPAKGCLHAPVSATCSDGSVCTQIDACSLGVCVGSKPLFCSDGNACTDDSCDKLKGCLNLPNSATCSDGSVCTLGDACTATVCKAGLAADCGDGNACTTDQCDPATGCNWPPVACDDKLACTSDSCDKQSGCANLPQDASCTDSNPCTNDSCDQAKGCVYLANSATCSDGDACTSGDGCAAKACATSGKLDCDDKNVCTFDTCDTIAGCVNQTIPNAISCDDGSVCTTVDTCVGGKCAGGMPKACGDGNPCSTGGCDPKTGCVSTPVLTGSPCDDGNACTKGDNCANAKCLPGAVTTCDDGNGCTNDSCDKAKGCQNVANTASCSDGNSCTTGDVCAAGSCKSGTTLTACDDGNKCTLDSCDKLKGCVAPPAADGVACGTSATCKAGVCVGAGKALVVGAGGHHTCVLTALKSVMCWGRNHLGQLGDGTLLDRYNPTPVALPGEVSAIAIGGDFSCALLSSGAVHCWGDNAHGQLGDNSTTASKLPVAVNGLGSGVKAIAAGAFHACAITTAGAAKCWGLNSSSQLGNGSTVNGKVPVQVSVLDSTVTAIAAGGAHTCAIAFDGLTLCWGSNASGQLGNGTTASKTEPELVPGLTAPTQAIDAGAAHTCAVKADGTLWCWGQSGATNGYNKLLANSTAPVKVNSGVAQVSAALSNTCTLLTNGKVYCRGFDGNGEIGNALFDAKDAGYADTLVQLNGPAKFIATGGNHSCAVLTSGDLQCWGHNLYGQIGLGQPSYITTPKAVVGLPAKVKTAATGGNHTCATLDGGAVYCWGLNGSLQVGQPKSQAFSKPMAVGSVGGGSTVVKQISAGTNHTCVVMDDGGVSCWGDNSKSQLAAPAQPVGPAGVASLGGPAGTVVAGSTHSCATVEGGVKCWGAYDNGQLGNGGSSATPTQLPVTVVGVATKPALVVAGSGHTCALIAGAVSCWGSSSGGQLGSAVNLGGSSSVPVATAGLGSGVTSIASGTGHMCAVLAGGAVKCWGGNSWGQLGNGTTNANGSSTAVQPTGLSGGVVALAAGIGHSCALLSSGAVQCWGLNDNGQLGDFSTTNKSVPTQVFGMASGVVAIAAGGSTTCALMASGAIKCWGANTYGQLGNGDTVKKNVPTLGPSLPNTTAITVGGNHACAIADGGKVYCWGAGALYQMGDGTATASNTSVKTLGIVATGALALGDTFSEVLALGSTLRWGSTLVKANSCNPSDYKAPSYDCWVPSGATDKATTVRTGSTMITAGAAFACDLTTTGAVRCVGDSAYLQCGVVPPTVNTGGYWWGNCYGGSCYTCKWGNCLSPSVGLSVVPGLPSGAKWVSAGARHACAVTDLGAVKCWGRNLEYQVGHTSSYYYDETWPDTVTGLATGAKAVAAGGSNSCALLQTGAVKCWGQNLNGEVGDNSQVTRKAPTAVVGLSTGVTAIAAGPNHFCAHLSTGAVQCWGFGGNGQLGNGSLAGKLIPTDIPALGTDVATLVAGSTANHTCAVLKDGSLRCWGQNLYGQIGDGVPLTHTPAYVLGFGP